MTRIDILTEAAGKDEFVYRAVSGEMQSVEKTVGETPDAITNQLPEEETGTLVVVQWNRPDAFFATGQRQRLDELMTRWRVARDSGDSLPEAVQSELDALVETELRASTRRSRAVLAKLSG